MPRIVFQGIGALGVIRNEFEYAFRIPHEQPNPGAQQAHAHRLAGIDALAEVVELADQLFEPRGQALVMRSEMGSAGFENIGKGDGDSPAIGGADDRIAGDRHPLALQRFYKPFGLPEIGKGRLIQKFREELAQQVLIRRDRPRIRLLGGKLVHGNFEPL
ncbi:hypothetical protein [Sphingomonas sp.]|uniref:hypothetical protein n=1 Tax=Sphingomonas sp. TaxID=28214 RepID=UPI0025FBE166|nr:hypothetical protein [Sphingomonas sp.]